MNISQWLYREQIESTNDWMKSNHHRLPVGTCIYAESQKIGRGRGGNKWESPRGGLYFSVLLSKGPRLPDNGLLMSHFSHYSRDFLNKRYKLQIGFKPPNDLYIEGRKLMGVLIDNVFLGNCLTACILGVGLNVNGQLEDSINLNGKRAISLQELLKTEKSIEINKLMVDMLEAYETSDLIDIQNE